MDRADKPSFGHGYAIETLRQVATQTLKQKWKSIRN